MILDPDYARIFTQARIIAWQYGYACVAHGSYTRDLDLLLVPWTESAHGTQDQLAKLVAQSGGLVFRDRKEDIFDSALDWTQQPHGRRTITLFFPEFHDRRWVDLSIMPTAAKAVALAVIEGAKHE